jgi:hypothetical protein
MDWEAEVATARRIKQEQINAERDRVRAAESAVAQRDAIRNELCDALEQVRDTLIRADWPAAGWYRPGFVGYLKPMHTLRGQTFAEMRVTEIVASISGEGTGDIQGCAHITYHKYPDIHDGHLIWVTAGLGGAMREEFRVRDVKFLGTAIASRPVPLVRRSRT